MPALLIRISSRSVASCTALARRRASAKLLRSALKKVAAPPAFSISATTRAPLSASRPCTRTRAPPSASWRATNRPTPSVDPVTSTVFPISFSKSNLPPWPPAPGVPGGPAQGRLGRMVSGLASTAVSRKRNCPDWTAGRRPLTGLRSGGGRSGGGLVGLDALRQGGGQEAVDIAVEHRGRIAGLDPGAQILDHLIGLQHVGADLVAPADIALGGVDRVGRFLALLQFQLVQPRLQHRHRARPVLVLRALALARHGDPGRQMRQPHRAVGLVDVLPAGPRRAVGIDP